MSVLTELGLLNFILTLKYFQGKKGLVLVTAKSKRSKVTWQSD